MKPEIHSYTIKPNDGFPNNAELPLVLHRHAIKLPTLLRGLYVRRIFRKNGWTNNWKDGIYEYDHYHSNTHEAIAVIKGKATLLFGGRGGKKIDVREGDVVIIPAGVAHCTLGKEDDVTCIGGYPQGSDYDMHYGHPGERPRTDRRIARLPVPKTDPVFGTDRGLPVIWKKTGTAAK